MERITRKTFTDIICNNTSVFCGSVGSVRRWGDEKILRAMENTMVHPETLRRTVAEKHSNYIIFSNGSRLDFAQSGKNEYFEHTNKNGVKFIWQRLTVWDDFDKMEYQSYIVYAIIEAEADADIERTYKSVYFDNELGKIDFCRWLRANGYKYETSALGVGYDIEILCSKKEAEIINGKLA